MKLYEGRKALVTGSASGIGKNLVEHLVSNGAKVICCDINSTVGQASVDAVNAGTGLTSAPVAFFMKLDVRCWEQVTAAFKYAEVVFHSKLDFVFANAGTQRLGGFPNEPGNPNTSVLDVNVQGVVYTMQAAIDHFRAYKSGGSIIATASIAGFYPLRPDPIYTASKHAVIGLVRATALRTRQEGIYVNAVAPATTESGLVSKRMMDNMTALGLSTTMENIIKAFDTFLTPDCRLAGQIAEPIDGRIDMIGYPTLPNRRPKEESRL